MDSTIDQTTLPTPDPLLPLITGEHWIGPLQDGTAVLIRPLHASDRAREEAFIRRLSPESRRFRFLAEMRQPPASLIDTLMDVDGAATVAYVALAHEDGELREVGISRYAAANRTHCECAVTVADNWRNRGLASALLRHLVDTARRHRFKVMYSVDMAEDHAMASLARQLGFTRTSDPEDPSMVTHTLVL